MPVSGTVRSIHSVPGTIYSVNGLSTPPHHPHPNTHRHTQTQTHTDTNVYKHTHTHTRARLRMPKATDTVMAVRRPRC
jgi:hypothetical protein